MSEAQDEEAFAKEGKYQKFQYAVERALKNFELSSQWTDQVSHLTTLHKVLLAYTQYPVVPLKYQLNRRLSQCLHYKLPHGVHLKTLDVYCAIFDRIKSDGLSADLHVYCSGLFPLMTFANISVRTKLLDVYEKYLLPLGHKLVPALSGFVLGLLPGLEENSDHSDKILGIMERIWHEIGRTELLDALWNSIILSSSCRVAALNLLSTKLQQEQRNNKKIVDYDKPLSRAAFQAALSDNNEYAQRIALDLILVIYSFDKRTSLMFTGDHIAMVLCPALNVLLRRDQSLTRRVYCWLLGDSNKEENLTHPHNISHDENQSYFDTHVRMHIISALRMLLTKDIVSCLKIVHFLFDKTSICESIKDTVMLDMAWGVYKRSLVAGGLKHEGIQTINKTKKKQCSSKVGFLRAANLLFQTFGQHYVWEWLEQFLKQSCDPSGHHSNGIIDDEEMNVTVILQVMLLLVKLLPLESYGNHLSSILVVLLNILLEHYSELMKQGLLLESLTVVKSLLCLLHNQSLQKLSAPPSKSATPISNRESSSSPDNLSSEVTKSEEQTSSVVGVASCDCKNTMGMADVVKAYLVLFPKLIFDACKLNHFDQSKTREWEGSKEAMECCQCSCDLLADFLSLPLSTDDFDVARDEHQMLPDWVNGLFSCCIVNHGDGDVSYHHMMLRHISIFCYLLEEGSSTVISRELKFYIFHQTKFCQQVSKLLYSCLEDVRLQPDASRLLHRLHTLVKPLVVCEMIILEEFSKHQDIVKPYQCYAVICQHIPHWKTVDNQPRPFLRAGLRMLEGLQSSSPTVRSFVQHWIKHTCRRGSVGVLLSPILALLHEIPIRKQHFKMATSRSFSTCYQFTEPVDTRRACFAMNLLTSLLEVGGAGLVQHFVGTTKQQQPQQSMLQDILSLLMAILLADYSERMNLGEGELAAALTMKCAVCNCLNELFGKFVKVIRTIREDNNNSGSSGFFLSLLFLCEVQKLMLLMLCELQEGLQNADSPSHESEPLLHSLLQSIGQILVVESLSVLDDSISNHKSFTPKKLNSALLKKTFVEANPLCSQPLFYALIMNACKNGQFCFLDMMLKYLPYFNPSLMVPQLLSIISEILRDYHSVDTSTIHLLFAIVSLTRFAWQEELPFLTYTSLQPLLNYMNVLHFIPTLADLSLPRFKVTTAVCDPVAQPSSGGPISWLFLPIWSQRKVNDTAPMCGPLQEAVLEQLPQLYGILTMLWSSQDDSLKLPWCNSNEPIIFEDVKLLMHELLLSPLSALPEAFMSTLAEMWMNWSSDAKEDRRTNFITLLHTVKLVELCDFLEHIRKTLLLLGQMDNSDAGAVRQKYLLHFLYKYLSSSQQSADTLEQCYSTVLTFLKDCHQHLSHPESICLLTSILHVLVCRTTSPVEKKIRRELQETIHLLCVSLSVAAGVATSHGYVWLQRNTAISVPHLLPSSSAGSTTPSSPRSPVRSSSPNLFRDEDTAPSSPTRRDSSLELPTAISSAATSTLPIHHQLQMPTIQALAVLSNVLSQFVDYVYLEKEKDKITSLLTAILYNVWPHLSDHSSEHQLCYEHSVSLLTLLTDFSVAHKSWKKETAALFLQPEYFYMPSSCIDSWLTIIDNLMTQDKSAMKNFLSQIKPLSVPLMTKDQLTKLAGLIKRLAFVLFAGEVDQYENHLRDMQDKLLESLGSVVTSSQVLLCYHVMLLRFSPKHLQLIWPTVTSELARICHSLFKDLQQLTGVQSVNSHEVGLNYSSSKPPSLSQCALYINVCQLVHTMLTISVEQLPQFQHIRWYFEGPADDADNSVLNGIGGLCDKLDVELVTPKPLAGEMREIKTIIKRISSALSSRRYTKPTSKDMNEIEDTLKLMFLTN